MKGRENLHGQTLTLGSSSHRLGIPVLGSKKRRPWLLGELLGQMNALEKPKLYLSRVYECWLVNEEGGESSELVAAALPPLPSLSR